MEQFTDLQATNIYQPSVADPFATEYASTGQRFLNYIIDTIVMYIFAFGTGIILAVFYYASGNETDLNDDGSFNVILMLVMLFLIVAYYTFSEAVSHGRSIGKLITRTKAVRLDESEISWKDALIRSICRLVPFEPFSALGGNPWHDNWSNTKVIKLQK